MILRTNRALGFAQDIQALINSGFDFAGTPTVFGAKVSDVEAGATPAVGSAHLTASFVIPEPGAPLPDFIDVTQNNNAASVPISFEFISKTHGRVDSKPGCLQVRQVASDGIDPSTGAITLNCTEEVVDIGRTCGRN